jgi:DNA mismatch endonuclease (patch repair protein)
MPSLTVRRADSAGRPAPNVADGTFLDTSAPGALAHETRIIRVVRWGAAPRTVLGGANMYQVRKELRDCLPKGEFIDVTVRRSALMRAVRSRGNASTERRLRAGLVRAGIRGWSLHADIPGKPDFLFREAGLAVFVDGCFWHGCPVCGHIPKTRTQFWAIKICTNQTRDRVATRGLRRRGLRVLRFWEHEVKQDLEDCIRRIAAAKRARRLQSP